MALLVMGCMPDQLEDVDLVNNPEVMFVEELSEENLRVNPAAQNQLEAVVRKATAKYQRVEVAVADGYELASPCVATAAGGMGFHYVNFALMDGILDPSKPEALVYEPLPNGRLKLGAIEYIVVDSLLDVRGVAPMFGRVPMDNHLQGAPLGFPHFQLHVWVWTHNPAGVYTPFNPKVRCF
ncbi:hypothetical protein KIH41_14870 [Litoribacter ruber]|uniref:Uncharacterized protein n=2 Tax=Litoribacter ruber TaxID=702568 RepID=A0AAP2CJI3_9BACT|nr:hypothetical protein [Litoribacter alkaliphilus]MBT0812568.1 hypothetical protein [Litoribacter ruber]